MHKLGFNSVGADGEQQNEQMMQNVVFDQTLHCLPQWKDLLN